MKNSDHAPLPGTAISVSQLNRRARNLLEQGIARLWVEGEISNIARPASGHMYFSLKDDAAQVRAALFRQRRRGAPPSLRNGDKVLAYGRVSIYEARGDYQLIVERVEPAGEGALMREFERLKKKLEAEGLFEADRKRPLPGLPLRVGLITSPSGAAVRDMLTVLERRFPSISVVIYPAAVQGEAAPGELEAALDAAVRRDECDVLIIGRGGGSLEDLWAFNDERLARAIAACPIPIVSAVGHEVDFTIADFVADVRAPTPSGAAELVVPDRRDWLSRLQSLALRVTRLGRRSLQDRAQALDWLSRRLMASNPGSRLARQRERLGEVSRRLAAAVGLDLERRKRRLEALRSALKQRAPRTRIEQCFGRQRDLAARLEVAIMTVLADAKHRSELAARALKSVSPLATLERGYAIVMDEKTGRALVRAADAAPGSAIRAKLYEGELLATVRKVRTDEQTGR